MIANLFIVELVRRRLSGLSRMAAASVLAAALGGAAPSLAETLVTTSTAAGLVDGFTGNSDEFIWRLLVGKIGAPVDPGRPTPAEFEIWASDPDVFSKTPHFPTASEPHKFGSSLLGNTATVSSAPGSIDNVCRSGKLPPNTFTGGFPRYPVRTACIAEEVKRNRPEYDYIVKNKLNTQAGLRTAYDHSFDVDMPATSISVKGDWIPVSTLLQWIPQLGSQANVEKTYLTTTVDSTEFALVSLHVSSKRNTRWVWATFEHQMTPGRCDYIGCYDSFGAVAAAVQPNLTASNTQYGACTKGPALRKLVSDGGLSPAWLNYCLKGSMVTFTAFDGKPISLANSVTEGINAGISVIAGSCMGCHAYAAFAADGRVSAGGGAMLNQNPTGLPHVEILKGSRRYDFMWGFLAAP